MEAVVADLDTPESFPEEWKKEFEGLLYLGYLEKEVLTVPNHTFVVRTLTIAEKLGISLLTKEYMDTVGYGRAYRSAVVAAGLVSVDNRPLIGIEKDKTQLRQKFDYVTNGWHDIVVDILFGEIDILEGRVVTILQELDILPKSTPTPIFKDEKESDDDPKDTK